jgi:predicted membrane channel-forming protein YqfA (hemolysin III family)
MSRSAQPERVQTLGEEVANAIRHGQACLRALASLPMLVSTLYPRYRRAAPIAGSTGSITRRSTSPWPAASSLSGSARCAARGAGRSSASSGAWHLLVIGGSACHAFAALWHAR